MSLDLFWLRDESLEDSASLPEPQLLAQEIADDLRSALVPAIHVAQVIAGRPHNSSMQLTALRTAAHAVR